MSKRRRTEPFAMPARPEPPPWHDGVRMPWRLYSRADWRLLWLESISRWALAMKLDMATIRLRAARSTKEALERLGLVAPEGGLIKPAAGIMEELQRRE